MTGRQKALLIVVPVVLVALFVLAVAGGDPGRGDPAGSHPFVASLADLTGGRGTVGVELVSADCLRPDRTLLISGVCTLQVADPGGLKLLVLRAGTPFTVTAPAPGHADYTATDDVAVGDDGVAEARIAVDKPADVLVRCPGLNPCVLRVGDR